MGEIIEKYNKLSLPTVILVASIIFGIFFYMGQISKQHSIEEQQRVKIEQEKQDKEQIEQKISACLDETVSYYDNRIEDYCKNHVVEENCRIPQEAVGIWLKNQRLLRDECFKRYSRD